MTDDFENYGPMQRGGETDIRYRIRDDGKFVALFDAEGEEFLAGMRVEDVAKIMNDMYGHGSHHGV